MAKNRAKKRQREEKAKVKFKVGKTLTKGQNVTDLKFRTRRIVVPDQLKQPEPGLVLSSGKRKSLKELLTMLTSFNHKARLEALEGISEITKENFGEISTNLVPVVTRIATVCSDKEDKVRKRATSALKEVLSRATPLQLQPTMHALSANLSSSMTHVDPDIRGDSLSFLDVVLETHPTSLLTSSSEERRKRLFNDFLSQISAPLKGEASGLKTASVAWFSKVLSRLKLLCSKVYVPVESRKGKELEFNRKCPIYACLDAPAYIFSSSTEAKLPSGFVSSLTPILITVASEVAGRDDTLTLDKAEAATCVAELLSCFLSSNSTAEVFPKDTSVQLGHVFRHFPYEVIASAEVMTKKNKKRKKNGEEDVGLEEKTSVVAVKLNVNLIHVLASAGIAGKLRRRMIQYFCELLAEKSWVGRCSSLEIENAATSLCKISDDVRETIVDALAAAACELHALKRERVELSKMLVQFRMNYFLNQRVSEKLQRWIESTVDTLEEDVIRPEVFSLLISLSKLGDSDFKRKLMNSLQKFCRDVDGKSLHKATWDQVSLDFFYLLSWASVDLSPRDRAALLNKGCLTEMHLRSLQLG